MVSIQDRHPNGNSYKYHAPVCLDLHTFGLVQKVAARSPGQPPYRPAPTDLTEDKARVRVLTFCDLY